ncbi:hypothetical protein [Streptomyces sp. XY431]|uniref:hypothetical protein n=1 Tax=Streptomyces sp. XY431 TaxID=1415562 RepID=UPI000AA3C06D|nr:hypothetical protein [Streptomyces sp. XY431]
MSNDPSHPPRSDEPVVPPAPPHPPRVVAARSGRWSDLAAIVTALTGVGGLALGFLGLPAVINSPTAARPVVTTTVSETVTATVTVTATPRATSPAVPDATNGSAAGTADTPAASEAAAPVDPGWLITYNGQYVVDREVDLDPNNPSSGWPQRTDLRITGVVGGKAYLAPDNDAVLARVPDGEPVPGPKRCQEIASTLSDGRIVIPVPGDRFCLRTAEGYPRYFKVLSVDNDAEKPKLRIDLLGWAGQ